MREIAKLVLVLGLICGISAGSLSTVRTYLADRIEQQNDLFVRGPALELLLQQPAQDILANKLIIDSPEGQALLFYIMDTGRVSGLAIETVGKGGYGGDISLMLGVNMESNQLLGLEIIKHQETPGIGAQIEKTTFLRDIRTNPQVVQKRVRIWRSILSVVPGSAYEGIFRKIGSRRPLGFTTRPNSA